AGPLRSLDHFPGRLDIRRNRLLHLDVLFRFGADLERLKAEIGEGADVDIIDFGMAAHFLICLHELRPVLGGESPAALLEDVGADRELESDILVCLRVLMRNRAGSDHSYSQVGLLVALAVLPPVSFPHSTRPSVSPAARPPALPCRTMRVPT